MSNTNNIPGLTNNTSYPSSTDIQTSNVKLQSRGRTNSVHTQLSKKTSGTSNNSPKTSITRSNLRYDGINTPKRSLSKVGSNSLTVNNDPNYGKPLKRQGFKNIGSFKEKYHGLASNGFHRLRRISRADISRIADHRGIPLRFRGQFDFRLIVSRFEKQSTFHGICHAATAPNYKWRIMWYSAFSICFLALIIQVFYLIRRYRMYEKTVDLDLKFESAPFPAVTICNLNPYKASAIQNDPITKSTMDAFTHLMNKGASAITGLANELAAAKNEIIERVKREEPNNESRRYLQVLAQCYCEISTLSGIRKKGSCFAAYKGNISLTFTGNNLHNFHPSKCLCQLDRVSKTLWPCFPKNSWEKKMCSKCVKSLGHCPMKHINKKLRNKRRKYYKDILQSFNKKNQTSQKMNITNTIENTNKNSSKVGCRCHEEYNHCVMNPENGYIPEIVPNDSLDDVLKRDYLSPQYALSTTTTTTTTQAPSVVQALGLEELEDEIAITTQAQQNLMFAVGAKPMEQKIAMSQKMSELILKCSFNQRDCDFKKDFKLHYDATYGNCYTFNWDRSKNVSANRAGANYGLRLLLFANISEYLPTTESVGFRITVHDKWITPFPDAFGYSAPTGFMTSFGVRMKQFIRLPAPYGRCLDYFEADENFHIYRGYNYSVESCHRSCTQREVIKACGCSDPMYPGFNNSEVCSVLDPVARRCIQNITSQLTKDISEGLYKDCICHQPCLESGYEVSFSAARWPSGTSKIMECEASNDLCMEKYKKNAAMVQIFYEELNFETLTESPAYSLTSALADLGGLTGLWIGASVVSLLEIVALIIYTTQAYVQKKKLESAPPPKMSSNRSLANISKKSIKLIGSEKSSKQSVLQEVDETKTEETLSEIQKSSTYYIPPGADLPCICSYNAYGHIEVMKVLCPQHGYLLRARGIYEDDIYADEWEEEEEENIEEEEDDIVEGEEIYSQMDLENFNNIKNNMEIVNEDDEHIQSNSNNFLKNNNTKKDDTIQIEESLDLNNSSENRKSSNVTNDTPNLKNDYKQNSPKETVKYVLPKLNKFKSNFISSKENSKKSKNSIEVPNGQDRSISDTSSTKDISSIATIETLETSKSTSTSHGLTKLFQEK
ncbi:Na+ channel, amiloride-sensitive family and Degenerin family-containing protein [Strongyloides ratti]|uniref:Na+ channel, amiloride-sensitive family and Degenerin family-containing protein n=1 Tax=Strongyloides ratti TaxID=34506 RepID=A0A090KRT5_STRRB|nr:Na+ channel, amiloride-sensitive family and Degenerin family-containing protein [Strongyloides ratti]CEF60105.1 Na+ channel, amiloride-sensitive family and Degenerin family-containing protein [Strongyloides ratti]